MAHLGLVGVDPSLSNGHQPQSMFPFSWGSKRFCKDVSCLPIGANINEVKLFLLKLLFHPFKTDVLSFVGVPHGGGITGAHHSYRSLIIFHELHLIELRKMGLQTIDICRRKAPLNIAIPDFIDLFVDTSKNRITLFGDVWLGV